VSGSGRYAGKSVLVTGAEGFIGSWLSQRLLDEGAKVVALRRDVPSLSYFRVAGLEERCEIVQGELLDHESLMRIIDEHHIWAVFHLAAQPIVGTANRSPLSTFETNIRGTYMLLEACRATGAVGDPVERIVVASSDKAYGEHEELPYHEDLALRPRFPYEVSKACADFIARSYAEAFELPVAVTRLANVYGGGDLNFSRIVPDTIQALVRGDRPLIRSDGTPQRDFIYIEDAVDAYLSVADSLERPELRGRAWNAGNGEPISVLDLVRRLIEVSGRELEPKIDGEGTPAGEIDRQWLDSSSIRSELRWEPRWELGRGLAETYAWYDRHLT
jgi:CDP-glucose 4,6-dehydratase